MAPAAITLTVRVKQTAKAQLWLAAAKACAVCGLRGAAEYCLRRFLATVRFEVGS